MSKAGFEPRIRARRRALQALYQWQMTGHEAHAIISQFKEVQNMGGVDVEYFEQLVHGVSRLSPELDEHLAAFVDRDIEQLDEMERAILRMGAYELLHCPELPFRVVLDQCVDLAHRFGSVQGHSYVNAVLDKARREWRPHESAVE